MKVIIALALFTVSFTIQGQAFYSDFSYEEGIYKGIRIQNSFPKGGQKYKAPNGKEYVYVVFWTQIRNESEAEMQVRIDFSADSFVVPSSPFVDFNLYLPSEEMTLDKEALPNYGLDIKSYLDKNIDKASGLFTSISPKGSYLFYMIAISSARVDGTLRAGFELKQKNLIYKINNHEIICGRFDSYK